MFTLALHHLGLSSTLSKEFQPVAYKELQGIKLEHGYLQNYLYQRANAM